ncbi:NADAR family protein [Microscilla marina]|uniref:GTP cyclohydrolase II n=1 Tax=Microscilla marina ATCC 23134 TaxID=313606 RepID=A2A058_MICM2|nr:NADAR family protein [Microscilla marina]EAY23973.1 GTP cyclohydrolase II [Microscilla marina ATCC 23134]
MILPHTTFINQAPLFLQVLVHYDQGYLAPFEFELPPLEEFRIDLGNQPEDDYLSIELMNKAVFEEKILPRQVLRTHYLLNHWQVSVLKDQVVEDCESTFDFSQAIYFYAKEEAYGELSNFADFGIEINGLFYPTIEHYYQAQKFDAPAYCEKIRLASTPKEAAELGKTRELPLKSNWDQIKSDIMWQAVQVKCNTHPSIAQILRDTGDVLLIENSPYDEYWGIGRAGKGHNHLGTLLMRARKQL